MNRRLVIASFGLLTALLGHLPIAPASTASTESPAAAPDGPSTAAFHREIEELLQKRSGDLSTDFAGAWIDPENRNRVFIGLRGRAGVDRLRADVSFRQLTSDPRIEFVALKFAQAEFDQGIVQVVTKLNKLLANPRPKTSWPFEARVNAQSNLVDVFIDRQASARRDAIEQTLGAEIQAGLVRISYDREVSQYLRSNICSTRSSCQPPRGGLRVDVGAG